MCSPPHPFFLVLLEVDDLLTVQHVLLFVDVYVCYLRQLDVLQREDEIVVVEACVAVDVEFQLLLWSGLSVVFDLLVEEGFCFMWFD